MSSGYTLGYLLTDVSGRYVWDGLTWRRLYGRLGGRDVMPAFPKAGFFQERPEADRARAALAHQGVKATVHRMWVGC